MTDVERRRSRLAWPTRTEPTTTPAGTHDHGQRNGPVVIAYVAIVLLLVTTAALAYFVWVDHQYVQGRGEYRDREIADTNQRINDAICDLLDQLPEGGLLDGPRGKYGCGPGIPLEDFPEDVRRRYEGEPSQPAQAAPAPAPAPVVTTPPAQPDPMGGATTGPRPPASSYRPPPTTPPPPPAPTPGPLDPITDTVCDLTAICIEEP